MSGAERAPGEDLGEDLAEELAVLERRAARVRARPASLVEEEVLWVAEFPLGEVTCALPLLALRAAVPLRNVTPVPLAPPHVIGLFRYQGQILTALNLASLLGGHGWREDPAVLLVVESGFGLLALDCERVPQPLGIPRARVVEPAGHGATAEITLPDQRKVLLLDLRRLVDRRDPTEPRHA